MAEETNLFSEIPVSGLHNCGCISGLFFISSFPIEVLYLGSTSLSYCLVGCARRHLLYRKGIAERLLEEEWEKADQYCFCGFPLFSPGGGGKDVT